MQGQNVSKNLQQSQNQTNREQSFLFSEVKSKSHESQENQELQEIKVNQSQLDFTNIQPNLIFYVSLGVSSSQITREFLTLAEQMGYEAIENEKDQILVIKKNQFTLKQYLLSCMLKQFETSNVSAIKIHVKTNQNQCNRKVSVKGLKGSPQINGQLVNAFKNFIEKQKQNNLNNTQDDPSYDLAFNQPEPQEEEDEEEVHNNSPYTLESTANFMFHKILSASKYGIGQKIVVFLNNFEQKYNQKDVQINGQDNPIKEVYMLVNEVVDNLFTEYNYGKSDTKQIMPYCKISVEKYVFSKIENTLMALYIQKNNENQKKFNTKRQKILNKLSIKQIFSFLDSNKKYWLVKGVSEKENCKKKINLEDDTEKAIAQENDTSKPYNNAISEIQKISHCSNPREKLKCIMMMRSMMRAGVLDFHSSQEELASMDDELPVVIYIVLMSKISNLLAELNLVDNFISQDSSLESEKRFLINLQVSTQYIQNEWEMED
ncbi:hypothetical protein PPERSA_08701 [Pseudocohnilembus persalinus]|uniref:VPS9 domain-containing protein n=1 Tax=Pseudocohnilembus persalinus TaxID=266149 RepID=A0A0V0R8A9_PSEPJ|nr:hypothetical protein PPERSA_08701 [Pseudocohnilembus persalinus]|eukprot:KRX10706.1 hypothetical protein PPERSA_08701 [Pseudocohnilembus persalinus]